MEISELERIQNIEYESRELDNQTTIGDFLKELLCRVWVEGDEFSGKRPFGNSDWQYEVYEILINNGVINGVVDEDGYIVSLPSSEVKKADKIILDIIVETM